MEPGTPGKVRRHQLCRRRTTNALVPCEVQQNVPRGREPGIRCNCAISIEEYPALVRIEEVTDLAEGSNEGIVGTRAEATEMGFRPGEGHFDRVQFGRVRREEEHIQQALAIRISTAFWPLWVEKLSRITTGPVANDRPRSIGRSIREDR